MVEYLALDSSARVAERVEKERDNYGYIYPVRVSERNHVWHMLIFLQNSAGPENKRLLKRSQPYRNLRIIKVIRDVYFSGGVSSFAARFNDQFPQEPDSQGVMKTRVPEHMVALVATAVILFILML